MRRTAKYVAGCKLAAELSEPRSVTSSHEKLYATLEARGYWWESESGEWSQQRKSTSIFEGDDGMPTGVFRLRVMANPSEMDDLITKLQRGLELQGCRVFEVSDRYPNRRGPGVRVYLSCEAK